MAIELQRRLEIASRLKELRTSAHETQPEVAAAVHVGLRAYQTWEYGENGINWANVKALAEHFGVTPDYIWSGTVPETPELQDVLLDGEDRGAELVAQVAELNAKFERLLALLEPLLAEPRLVDSLPPRTASGDATRLPVSRVRPVRRTRPRAS